MNKVIKQCKSCNDDPKIQCLNGKRKHLNGLRCCVCKMVKDSSQFNINNSRPDGFHTSCKDCMKKLPPRGVYASKKIDNQSDEKVKYFLEYQYMCSFTNKVFNINEEEFISIVSSPCHYCGGMLSGKDYCGLDRIDRTLPFDKINCIPCCELCNGMRNYIDKDAFLSHIDKIYKHRIKKD